MSDWKKEVEETEKALDARKKERQETKDARIVCATNHIGKTCKKRGKSNSENNHKKPVGFIPRNSTFVNHGGPLGMSDEDYRTYIKTGKLPSREDK